MTIGNVFETFITRYNELQQNIRLGDNLIRHIESQGDDGSWSDIDYLSSKDWAPSVHALRLSDLARAYKRKGHQLENNPSVLDAIICGVDYWIQTPVIAQNWWYNSIGIPCDFVVVAMLMSKEFGDNRLKGILSILDQAGKPEISESRLKWLPYNSQPGQYAAGSPTGANLVWLAWINMHCACLRGDEALFADCARLIWSEVEIGAAEGIQDDGTFYQHGARLQNFHYGLAFFEYVIQLAWLLRDTRFSIPDNKRRIITFYLLEGDRWMIRGAMTIPGTLDRASSRPSYLRISALSWFLSLWRGVVPGAAEEIDAFIFAQSDGSAVVDGFRHFPYGDFSAYHQPRFSIFLKTISTRTELSESINTENLCGVPYLNCGDYYLIRYGDEYYNMPPVWDWTSLPGLTMSRYPSFPVRKQYTGSVSSEKSGFTVMYYARQEVESQITWSVRKFWAFHDGMMICLLGGWELSSESEELTTALEQCRRFGPVYVCDENGIQKLADGDQYQEGVRWVMHRGVGYIPLQPSSMRIELTEVTRTWEQINAAYPDEPPVTEQRFLLQMQHHLPVSGIGYAVVCDVDAERLDTLTDNPPWTIIANDELQQCIRFIDGTTMAAFYLPGVVIEEGSEILSVDRSCLVLCNMKGICVSDPNWIGGQVHLTWHGKQHVIEIPGDGRTVYMPTQTFSN